MKLEYSIVIAALIIGASIVVSGGIYEAAPGGDHSLVLRLDKLTGQIDICGYQEKCVPMEKGLPERWRVQAHNLLHGNQAVKTDTP